MQKGKEGKYRIGRVYWTIGLTGLIIAALACGPLSNLPGGSGNPTPTLMSLDGNSDGGGGDGGALSYVSPDKSSLKSFRGRFVMSYSGTKEDGTPVEGKITMEQAHTSDPLATELIQTGEGEALDPSQAINSRIVQIGDTYYTVTTVDGVEKCLTLSSSGIEAGTSAMASPESFMGASDLSGARRVLPDEVVNGVLSQHWQFTKTDVSLMGGSWTDYTVDAWIAVDGGYAVRSTFVGDGDKVSWTGGKGHIEWTFDLLEVNTDITITPPEGCEAPVGADFPQMADAADVISLGSMINYTTASPMADVVAFYQAQMPGAGWTAGNASTDGPLATLEFTKDGKTATITISDASGKTNVLIQIQ